MGPDAENLRRLLADDLDLADAVPAARRGQAIEDCLVPEVELPAGPWDGPAGVPSEGIGLLVLKGLFLRRTGIGGLFGVELLGECDLLRPWQRDDVPTLALKSEWLVLEPARLAVLDLRFAEQLGAYPELMVRLFERTVRRARQLAVNMAIIHHARVDERLLLLFWHLASRWGRVRTDGVLMRLRLTHNVLADLVAARRPTVTSALSDLARRGLVRLVDEGWLLTGDPPSRLKTLSGVTSEPGNGISG